MAENDIYEIVDVQEQQGQQILNTYYYWQATPVVPLVGSIAQNLSDAWVDLILPTIAATQVNQIVHVSIQCRNLFDPLDTGETVSGLAGGWTVANPQELPTFAAWGFQLVTDNATVRPGSKRIAGLGEEQQDDGVPTPEAVAALTAAADIISAPIPAGIVIQDDTMFPVVVRRVREGIEGAYTYRLPESTSEAVYGRVLEAIVKAFITSQVSRKIGVGV